MLNVLDRIQKLYLILQYLYYFMIKYKINAQFKNIYFNFNIGTSTIFLFESLRY